MKTPIFNTITLFSAILFAACSKGPDPTTTSSNVPNVAVSLSININNQPYQTLQHVGGQAYASGGNRGIILYRVSSTQILAYDRTCTYDLPDAGGIVQGQTNNTAICLDCGSQYYLSNGGVASGPTTIGLKQYKVSFSLATNIATITN